jgi:hypothetical protein
MAAPITTNAAMSTYIPGRRAGLGGKREKGRMDDSVRPEAWGQPGAGLG